MIDSPLPLPTPADIDHAVVERRRKAEVCPMQEWLTRYGYTQEWLARKLKPRQDPARGAGWKRPVSANLIYLWFTRCKRPSDERISEMSRISKGAVTMSELRCFFDREGVVQRRARSSQKG